MARINGLACFFLVALRLVIGWHFAVEGYHKLRTHQIGKTATNTPWTSEPFFREGYGPLADWYREMLGVSDEPTLARLRDRAGNWPWIVRHEWMEYLTELSNHYGLTAEQMADVQAAFNKHSGPMMAWLEGRAAPTTTKPVAWGTVDVPQTLPARLDEYEANKERIRAIQQSEQTEFNKDVDRSELRSLKAENARNLNDILAEVDSRTVQMKKAVFEAAGLTEAQKKAGPLIEPPPPVRPIDRLNTVTMWMQLVLGGLLLVGLWTRLSSLVLASFLLQVVLIVPTLPWVSPPPGEMGHYLFVDPHVIEMVALLVLATIPTGRWFGIDALFQRRAAKKTFQELRADRIRDSLRQTAKAPI